jgi:hypothetical protein
MRRNCGHSAASPHTIPKSKSITETISEKPAAATYCPVVSVAAADLVETVVDFLDAFRPFGELHRDVVDLRVDDSLEHGDSVAGHDLEPWCAPNPCVPDERHPASALRPSDRRCCR